MDRSVAHARQAWPTRESTREYQCSAALCSGAHYAVLASTLASRYMSGGGTGVLASAPAGRYMSGGTGVLAMLARTVGSASAQSVAR